ncbi:MAG: NAD(P)-dependent oxidoreductase [Candidatus Anstonellales archaeon]
MKIALIGANSRIARYISEFIPYDPYSRQNISYDRESIANKVKGYDVVIIAIGITKGSADDIWRVNYKIVDEILQGLNSDRIIFLSSIAVYGRRNFSGFDESSPTRPNDAYGASKLAAERTVIQSSKRAKILRIGTVFGEYYEQYLNMLRAWKRHGPFYFGDGKNTVPFIYARDVAKFISKNLEFNNSDVINLTSPGIEFMQIIRDVSEVLGIQMNPRPVRELFRARLKVPIISTILGYTMEYIYSRKEEIYPITLSRSFNITKALSYGLELTEFKQAIKCFVPYIDHDSSDSVSK